MARVKYGAGVTPIRGNDLGTVFQTGKYASVIKSKSSGQGQQLRPNLNAQEALSKSSKLYDTLSPGQKADWIAAIPDFPSKDRYGNLLLSTPEDLFLRTVGRLPIDQQTALSKPAAPFVGTNPGPGRLEWDGSKLEYFPDPAPTGEAWSISLFVSPPLSVGVSTRAPNYRRLWFENNSTSGAPIDLTAAYISLFGHLPLGCHVLYCVEVYNQNTPQLLAQTCNFVDIPAVSPYLVQVGNGIYSPFTGESISTAPSTGVSFDPSTPFAIQAIVRILGNGTSNDGFGNAIYYSSIGGGSPRTSLVVYTRNDGRFRFSIIRNNSLPLSLVTVGTFSYGSIRHFTVTYTPATFTSADYEIYIDGVLQPVTRSGSYNTPPSPARAAQIGYNLPTGGNQRRVNGYIHDILHIVGRSLSASEVTDLHSGVLVAAAVPFISRHYTFEESSGTIVPEVQNSVDAVCAGFGTRTNYLGGAWRNAAGGVAT